MHARAVLQTEWVRRGRCWLLLLGSLELVGECAGLAGQELGACGVARVDCMPVVDLQPHVPLAQGDVVGFECEPLLLGRRSSCPFVTYCRMSLTDMPVAARQATHMS